MSRLVLGPTPSSIHSESWALSPLLKGPEGGVCVRLSTYLHLKPRLCMSGAILPLPIRAVMKCAGTNLLYNFDPKYHSQTQTARAILCVFGYWIEVYRDFAQSVGTNGGIYYPR
jgi:hypothetical protein